MRRRSRRGAMVIARTRAVPIHRQPLGRVARRRRFRPVRTGMLLGLAAVIRLARALRPRWRLAGVIAGFLTEVVGFNIFSGGRQVASSLVGSVILDHSYPRIINPTVHASWEACGRPGRGAR